jgi:pyrroline-5-carboxylate reductase
MGQSVIGKKKVAVLGAGKIGSILLQSFLRDGLLVPSQTWATVAHPERARVLKDKLKVRAGTDNAEAVRDADVIFLCVKPQVVSEVVKEIRAHLNTDQLLISVAASVPTEMIERGLEKDVPVVRAMPNTPCVLGAGMTALCKGKFAQKQHLDLATKFFDAVGRTVTVDEKHMDAVTGEWAGLYLHHSGVAGGGGGEGWAAARCGDFACGADNTGGGPGGDRDGRSSGAAERCSDDSGGMHD